LGGAIGGSARFGFSWGLFCVSSFSTEEEGSEEEESLFRAPIVGFVKVVLFRRFSADLCFEDSLR